MRVACEYWLDAVDIAHIVKEENGTSWCGTPKTQAVSTNIQGHNICLGCKMLYCQAFDELQQQQQELPL